MDAAVSYVRALSSQGLREIVEPLRSTKVIAHPALGFSKLVACQLVIDPTEPGSETLDHVRDDRLSREAGLLPQGTDALLSRGHAFIAQLFLPDPEDLAQQCAIHV